MLTYLFSFVDPVNLERHTVTIQEEVTEQLFNAFAGAESLPVVYYRGETPLVWIKGNTLKPGGGRDTLVWQGGVLVGVAIVSLCVLLHHRVLSLRRQIFQAERVGGT
jgi:hypothetical protein